MRKYITECIVLKSINYKDADKIYTLLSKDKGKITARARGIRKISSKRLGSLDSLNHVVICLAESSSGYKTITEVNYLHTFSTLKSTLDRSIFGLYVAELIIRNIEEDDSFANSANTLFTILYNVLTALNSPGISIYQSLSLFDYKILHYLGYALSFDKCVACKRPFSLDWQHYRFSFELGGLCCERCTSGGPAVAKSTALTLNSLTKINSSDVLHNHNFQPASEILMQFTNMVLGYSAKSMALTL